MPNKMYYLGMKIIGLAVFLVPLFLKGQGILTELSKPTVIILIVIGAIILILGDVLERKYKRKRQEGNFK